MGYGREVSTPVTVTTSAAITTADKTGIVYALTLISGTADSSIILKNGGSSGTDSWRLSLNGTTSAGETSESISFPRGLIFTTDIYATLAGTAAIAYVAYEEIQK